MNNYPRRSLCSLVLLAGCAGLTFAQATDAEPTLKVVKYAGLGDVIRQFKGKIVVVNVWADY